MTISAEMIADSISAAGVRISTLLLTYPRIIHSEFMTHGLLSKNSSSSRAIPATKMLKAVMSNPAEPSDWGKNQRGMQAGAPLKGFDLWLARFGWHTARRGAYIGAKLLQWSGAHKQVVNRVMEPWSHMTVAVTGTEWKNFFALRDHPLADPTIQELARTMQAAFDGSTPRLLGDEDWHLPFVTDDERTVWSLQDQIDLSVARTASTSYRLIGTNQMIDIADAARIVGKLSGPPLHASPFEHQAKPDTKGGQGHWRNPRLHGNLTGFIQYRKTIKGESIRG